MVQLLDSDIKTREVLESHNVRFHYPGETENKLYADGHFLFTVPSDFTYNRVGYASDEFDDLAALELGQRQAAELAIEGFLADGQLVAALGLEQRPAGTAAVDQEGIAEEFDQAREGKQVFVAVAAVLGVEVVQEIGIEDVA